MAAPVLLSLFPVGTRGDLTVKGDLACSSPSERFYFGCDLC